jgi:hypothetical protein
MGELRVRESCRQGLRRESRSVWRKPEAGHGRTGRAWAEGTLVVAIQETSQAEEYAGPKSGTRRAAIAMNGGWYHGRAICDGGAHVAEDRWRRSGSL